VLEGLDHWTSVACCATQSSGIMRELMGARSLRVRIERVVMLFQHLLTNEIIKYSNNYYYE
jgi:hypothetical protein